MQDSVLPRGVGLRKPHISSSLLSPPSSPLTSFSLLLSPLFSFPSSYSSLLTLLTFSFSLLTPYYFYDLRKRV